MKPDLPIFSTRDKNGFHVIGGLKLTGILTSDQNPGHDEGREESNHRIGRLVQWIETFSGPQISDGISRSAELRFIIQNEPGSFSRLTAALLFRFSGSDKKIITNQIKQHIKDEFGVLNILHEEGEWSQFQNQEELERIISPFIPKTVIEISQRTGTLTFGERSTFTSTNGIGFSALTAPTGKTVDSITTEVVFPYYPVVGGWSDFVSFLITLPHNSMLRLNLKPTLLSEKESANSDNLYKTLNRVSQGIPRKGEDTFTYENDLKLIMDHVTKNRFSFFDVVFEVHTELVTDGPVSAITCDMLGSSLSHPVDPESLMKGGYDMAIKEIKEPYDLKSWQFYELLKGDKPSPLSRFRYLMPLRVVAAAFHFPYAKQRAFPGIETKFLKKTSPSDMLEGDQVLAIDINSVNRNTVKMNLDDRRRHFYTVGQTGTGKSTFLEHQILQDIQNGLGVGLLDPHGELVVSVLKKIPPHRINDVIYINPADKIAPIGLNILEFRDEDERSFVIQELIRIFEQLFDERYKSDMTGPTFYHYMRMMLTLITSDPNHKSTILDLYKVFTVKDYYKRYDYKKNQNNEFNILDVFMSQETFDFKRGSEMPFSGYFVTKLDNFIGDSQVRSILCQPESTVHFDEIMNEGKILLVNLSSAWSGEINSRFLGMLIMSKIQMATMRRAIVAPPDRRDFMLYVDEFQRVSTSAFTQLLSEARKYKVSLFLANQFTSQLKPQIFEAIRGNVGSFLIFRVGDEDAKMLAPLVSPGYEREDLIRLPNWHGIFKGLKRGAVQPSFPVITIRDANVPDEEVMKKVIQLSREKYGQKKGKPTYLLSPHNIFLHLKNADSISDFLAPLSEALLADPENLELIVLYATCLAVCKREDEAEALVSPIFLSGFATDFKNQDTFLPNCTVTLSLMLAKSNQKKENKDSERKWRKHVNSLIDKATASITKKEILTNSVRLLVLDENAQTANLLWEQAWQDINAMYVEDGINSDFFDLYGEYLVALFARIKDHQDLNLTLRVLNSVFIPHLRDSSKESGFRNSSDEIYMITLFGIITIGNKYFGENYWYSYSIKEALKSLFQLRIKILSDAIKENKKYFEIKVVIEQFSNFYKMTTKDPELKREWLGPLFNLVHSLEFMIEGEKVRSASISLLVARFHSSLIFGSDTSGVNQAGREAECLAGWGLREMQSNSGRPEWYPFLYTCILPVLNPGNFIENEVRQDFITDIILCWKHAADFKFFTDEAKETKQRIEKSLGKIGKNEGLSQKYYLALCSEEEAVSAIPDQALPILHSENKTTSNNDSPPLKLV